MVRLPGSLTCHAEDRDALGVGLASAAGPPIQRRRAMPPSARSLTPPRSRTRRKAKRGYPCAEAGPRGRQMPIVLSCVHPRCFRPERDFRTRFTPLRKEMEACLAQLRARPDVAASLNAVGRMANLGPSCESPDPERRQRATARGPFRLWDSGKSVSNGLAGNDCHSWHQNGHRLRRLRVSWPACRAGVGEPGLARPRGCAKPQ